MREGYNTLLIHCLVNIMKFIGYFRELPCGRFRIFSEVKASDGDKFGDTHIALYIKEPSDQNDRRIVAAANRYEGDVIVVSARHHDLLMNEQLKRLKEFGVIKTTHTRDQGFIDNRGVFLSREEALIVAEKAGQINEHREKTDPEYMLFSEDLY